MTPFSYELLAGRRQHLALNAFVARACNLVTGTRAELCYGQRKPDDRCQACGELQY